VPDERAEVDGRRLHVEPGQERADGIGRAAVLPAEGRRHALPEIVFGQRLPREAAGVERRARRVAVDVDEARHDGQPPHVEPQPRLPVRQVAEGGNAVVEEADVRDDGLVAQPVVYHPAFEDDGEDGVRRLRRDGGGEQQAGKGEETKQHRILDWGLGAAFLFFERAHRWYGLTRIFAANIRMRC
jgi:hypothetical protein